MTTDDRNRKAVLSLVAVVAIAGLLAALITPDAADAALKSAAGGGGDDAGGFARFARFIDRLSDYVVPVGAAFSVLGLIWGGILFMTGDARAARVLGSVALGVGIVLLSKPIAA